MPRPHHSNPRPRQQPDIPTNPKHRRRIINLPQPLRILRILRRQNTPASLCNTLHLILSSGASLPLKTELRRRRRHPQPLQLRQRSLKQPLRRSQPLHRLAISESAPFPASTSTPSRPSSPRPTYSAQTALRRCSSSSLSLIRNFAPANNHIRWRLSRPSLKHSPTIGSAHEYTHSKTRTTAAHPDRSSPPAHDPASACTDIPPRDKP